jgi:hypothetical protein
VIALWQADGVFLVCVDEDVVVLDVDADRYACLIDAAEWLRPGPDGSLHVTGVEAARMLTEAGIAGVQSPRSPRRRPVMPRAVCTSGWLPSAFCTARAGVHLMASTRRFRARSLRALVDIAAAPSPPILTHPTPGPPAPGTRPTTLDKALAAYRSALPWIPGEGECLQRAFLLNLWLAHEGIAADWVFGVRTWPFGAHCWVQIDATVVGDSLERVTNYTPIMVV